MQGVLRKPAFGQNPHIQLSCPDGGAIRPEAPSKEFGPVERTPDHARHLYFSDYGPASGPPGAIPM